MTVVKRAEFTGDEGNPQVGDLIEYTIKVSNTGNVTLTNISVIDEMGDLDTAIESLEPGEEWTYRFEYAINQADINRGRVVNTVLVNDEETTVETPLTGNPQIELEKEADYKEYDRVGDLITYTFTVKNTGSVSLENINLYDETLGREVVLETTSLEPGQSTQGYLSYEIQEKDIEAGSFTNLARVQGFSPDGEEVEDSDDETINKTPDWKGNIHIQKIVQGDEEEFERAEAAARALNDLFRYGARSETLVLAEDVDEEVIDEARELVEALSSQGGRDLGREILEAAQELLDNPPQEETGDRDLLVESLADLDGEDLSDEKIDQVEEADEIEELEESTAQSSESEQSNIELVKASEVMDIEVDEEERELQVALLTTQLMSYSSESIEAVDDNNDNEDRIELDSSMDQSDDSQNPVEETSDQADNEEDSKEKLDYSDKEDLGADDKAEDLDKDNSEEVDELDKEDSEETDEGSEDSDKEALEDGIDSEDKEVEEAEAEQTLEGQTRGPELIVLAEEVEEIMPVYLEASDLLDQEDLSPGGFRFILRKLNTGTESNLVTDEEGRGVFEDMAEGEYILIEDVEGYEGYLVEGDGRIRIGQGYRFYFGPNSGEEFELTVINVKNDEKENPKPDPDDDDEEEETPPGPRPGGGGGGRDDRDDREDRDDRNPPQAEEIVEIDIETPLGEPEIEPEEEEEIFEI